MRSAPWMWHFVALAGCGAPGPGPAAPAAAPRVLVPPAVDHDGTSFDDLLGLAPAINAAVAAAADGHGERLVVYVESTADYGCACPPFVFAPFYNGANPAGYPMVRVAPGAVDPVPFALISARLRLTGRFTGARIDGFAWLTERGLPRQEGMDEFARPGPVFVVDRWCAEAEGAAPEFEAAAWRELTARGLLCPGAVAPPIEAPIEDPIEAPIEDPTEPDEPDEPDGG